MKHVMLDLETMGTGPRAAIVAIGACEFHPDGTSFGAPDKPLGETFYARVSLDSSMQLGLEVDASTVLWWMEQSDEARKQTFGGERSPLAHTLASFNQWVGNPKNDPVIWGNGATFDNVVLRSAFKACGITPNWSFRNDKCYRTVVNLLPKDTVPFVKYGTAHNALDDAIGQALHLQKVWKELGL